MKTTVYLLLPVFFAAVMSGCSAKSEYQAYSMKKFPCGGMSNPIDFQECHEANDNPYITER